MSSTTLITTGMYVPGLSSYDRILTQLMTRWKIPGGSIAVVKEGRLVLARGYGLANLECNEPVEPESLFRIASISKPITSVAILKLVEEGKLDIDAKVFSLLDQFKPAIGKTVDTRIYDITVRQLLQHTGGWNREQSFDPMFISQRIIQEMGTASPTSSETIIQFMLGQPLDFDPGSQYAYSNFGYCILGRLIEKVTGQTYYDYVRSKILEPAGIRHMRLGHSLSNNRYENEVCYYDYDSAPMVRSVFPGTSELVPNPYGGFYLEAMDAHGGWISSTIDLVRFVTALDTAMPSAVLKSETIALMTSRPASYLCTETSDYYGMGWNIQVKNGTNIWWHDGSLSGTSALLVRTSGGLAWAALFNTRPKDTVVFFKELYNSLWEVFENVTEWPSHDLFE
jgi:N-acyl-D-amino-acid deacylase